MEAECPREKTPDPLSLPQKENNFQMSDLNSPSLSEPSLARKTFGFSPGPPLLSLACLLFRDSRSAWHLQTTLPRGPSRSGTPVPTLAPPLPVDCVHISGPRNRGFILGFHHTAALGRWLASVSASMKWAQGHLPNRVVARLGRGKVSKRMYDYMGLPWWRTG